MKPWFVARRWAPARCGTIEQVARTADGSYAVTGMFSVVSTGGREYRYLDGTRVVRK